MNAVRIFTIRFVKFGEKLDCNFRAKVYFAILFGGGFADKPDKMSFIL
jgi:hypothetical protein